MTCSTTSSTVSLRKKCVKAGRKVPHLRRLKVFNRCPHTRSPVSSARSRPPRRRSGWRGRRRSRARSGRPRGVRRAAGTRILGSGSPERIRAGRAAASPGTTTSWLSVRRGLEPVGLDMRRCWRGRLPSRSPCPSTSTCTSCSTTARPQRAQNPTLARRAPARSPAFHPRPQARG